MFKGIFRWSFYLIIILAVLIAVMFISRTVTVISEILPVQRQECVVIDAGHGGEDGGAVSCSGIPESTYNLQIALRLNDLMHLLGLDTKMIRTTDVSVYKSGKTLSQKKMSDLKERVRMIHETENALVVSIHQNFFSEERYSGAQVFYANTDGSEELGKSLQAAFKATVNPESSRGCKPIQGIYLMDHIQCTGILVECGFLSNPVEEAKLRSEDYQKKMCCVIATTVSQYLSNT